MLMLVSIESTMGRGIVDGGSGLRDPSKLHSQLHYSSLLSDIACG